MKSYAIIHECFLEKPKALRKLSFASFLCGSLLCMRGSLGSALKRGLLRESIFEQQQLPKQLCSQCSLMCAAHSANTTTCLRGHNSISRCPYYQILFNCLEEEAENIVFLPCLAELDQRGNVRPYKVGNKREINEQEKAAFQLVTLRHYFVGLWWCWREQLIAIIIAASQTNLQSKSSQMLVH